MPVHFRYDSVDILFHMQFWAQIDYASFFPDKRIFRY